MANSEGKKTANLLAGSQDSSSSAFKLVSDCWAADHHLKAWLGTSTRDAVRANLGRPDKLLCHQHKVNLGMPPKI